MAAAPERPPYAVYAGLVAAYSGLLVGAGALSRALGREPQAAGPLDFALLGLATFKGARTLARDKVTSFVREPFVEGDAHAGGEEPIRDGGAQQAIGELVTCTRCIGTWIASGLITAQLVAPRFGRLLTLSLAGAAANDWLQAAFTAMTSKSNEIEQRVE